MATERLRVDYVDAKPQDRDWSEGWGETWEALEAVRCDECGAEVIGPDDHVSACANGDEDVRDLGAEGPMMNYLYPLTDDDPRGCAVSIADLPLCVITDEEGEMLGLALTGGGMDLSYEIAQAYIACGYFPPAHFRLPAMAGRYGDNPDKAGRQRNNEVATIVAESCEILARWATTRHAEALALIDWSRDR